MSSQSSRPPVMPSRPHLTSLMYSLPVGRLKKILNQVIPDATLGPVEELSSPQLSRLYTLTMSDDRKLLLSFAPSLAVRLLRHEATILSSEARLVHFITGSEISTESRALSGGDDDAPAATPLTQLIPKLVKHSSNNREMAYPYSIFEPTTGAPLSTLSIYLSLPERRVIDKQLGSMARSLASLTSPTGTFGMVSRVLPDPWAPKPVAGSAAPEVLDSKTWSGGFNTLLEGILRDGEDMNVLLPYETVRAHYQRLSWRLDVITIPRLVILDLGSETNIMVERASTEGSPSGSKEARMTGLRSWSQGVFGDPLVASCFEDPSEGFLEGWKGDGEDSLIEDEEGSEVRILLYRCYRAVVAIVTEYYRPKPDSSRRELAGRRQLTSTLAELEKIDASVNDALKRERELEEEAESSKRQKVECA